MAVNLSPVGGAAAQFFDNSGNVLTGGKLNTYLAGTTTPAVTYTTSAGNVAQSNPIILNASGRVSGSGEIWLTDIVEYKFVLTDSNNVLIATYDNITGINSTQSASEIPFTGFKGQTGFVEDLADDDGSDWIGFDPAGAGAVARSAQDKMRDWVSVKDFGAVGDGVANDTVALQNAINFITANNKLLRIPAGTYLFSALDPIDTNNISITGDGSTDTILKFTGTGIALDFGTSAGFRQGINISGFTVEGNEDTTAIIRATAIARCQWTDINVREADPLAGVGFVFRAIQLSRFDSLVCSQDLQAMINPPLEAFNIEALAPFGNSSNNTFTNLYAEGAGVYVGVASINIGVRISGGDNNVFIAGSPESCKTYGLLVASNCRYNTFIGFAFENLNSTADVADAGISSRYINCYSSQKFNIQGRSCVVQGGYFERIQIDSSASRARVQDVTINNWSTGSGGFVDNGISSFYSNIYDIDLGAFVYIRKDRVNIVPGTSPTVWANDTGQFVEVVIQSGTLTQVRMLRGADSWLLSTSIPNSYLVGPSDSIEISYSSLPVVSYVPYNGFQG